jgi:hypothetical protein
MVTTEIDGESTDIIMLFLKLARIMQFRKGNMLSELQFLTSNFGIKHGILFKTKKRIFVIHVSVVQTSKLYFQVLEFILG